MNGKRHYLWRAVDQEGEVLEAVVTTRGSKATALKFLKRVRKRQGCSEGHIGKNISRDLTGRLHDRGLIVTVSEPHAAAHPIPSWLRRGS